MRKLISFLVCICFFGCNENIDKFELCFSKKYPYYHPSLEYKGGFHEIKKHFYNNYKKIKGSNNIGIVRIQFNINCKGESGNFSHETYNLSYEKTEINTQIVSQLLNLTKTLNGWIPAYNDNGENVDSYKFLAFKINNGNLTDILPK
ncbi:conserved hypothetical protein [Tenacibaculum maritimum]|uniref:hypothetical protein n=1 Tax=Tenacibaculum maritimum TaxID=107401 RepID=UPI0012E6883F|nr:hypothetical protein [Tenacibaculum maritimum]CAA0230688.1 conserved hypothetical protein [Tenacibaculum maritimum]